MRAPTATREEIEARVDAALAARRRLVHLPIRERVDALAAAARRWREDGSLAVALVESTGFSPAMVDAVVPIAAEALGAREMAALVEVELGSGALTAPPPQGPAVVLHVLASNVPALGLPAIALGVLVGAVVVVKSGRHDPHSAPAFVDALRHQHPDLAETVVATYWPGGTPGIENALLARAGVALLTGGDAALAALAPRTRGLCIVHGPRISVAAVGRDALRDVEGVAAAIALDASLHDQRGCLSPHAVWVEEAGAVTPADFAGALVAALEETRRGLPPGRAPVEERAAVRVAWDAAEHEPGTRLLGAPGAGVILHDDASPRPCIGGRTLRVHPLRELAALPDVLPAGAIESVGIAGGGDVMPLAMRLSQHGVSRLCPVGRMQRPALSWPRGQHSPLNAILARASAGSFEMER
jgi:acyl-CoA reductase-like NAD-dependent aldehyde dehydrogenase